MIDVDIFFIQIFFVDFKSAGLHWYLIEFVNA